jgi:hypothetical protein
MCAIGPELAQLVVVETYTAYALLAGSVPLMLIGAPAALVQDWGAVCSLGWLEIGYMVVLPVYVGYMLWNWAIARRGAAKATSFSLLVPIASGVLSSGRHALPCRTGGTGVRPCPWIMTRCCTQDERRVRRYGRLDGMRGPCRSRTCGLHCRA